MGNGGSSLVDCVQECDTQRLKQQLAARVADVEDGDLSDAELHCELEDAVHTAVSVEITTPHQYQQLQIALELLLHVAPTALQTSECNESQWSALHRACVTSNLPFVAFLFHRYASYLSMDRDAFGLLPLDLVPPELSFIGAHTSTSVPNDSIKTLPSTERERIELALAVLRQRKRAVQNRVVRSYLSDPVDNQHTPESEARDGAPRNNHDEPDHDEPYFIAIEPSRGQLSHEVVGVVHQLDLPLRVKYHLPRADAFVFGYFQLIWRADDEPRSQEPNYEHHVLLRESVDLDHAAPRSEDLTSNQHEQRRLHDADKGNEAAGASATLTGSVAIDVSHLEGEVVCHVLFVASDRQLMKREIVLSTEGVRLVRVDALNADPLGGSAAHESYYEEPPFEYDVDSDGDNDLDGFVFHVGGEAFKHPSEELAGRAFDTIEEFEAFVKQLRATAKQRLATTKHSPGHQEESESIKDTTVRRPSVLSNQDQVSEEAEDQDDDEIVLVEASKESDVKRSTRQHEADADDNQVDA